MEGEPGKEAIRDTVIRMIGVVVVTGASGFLYFRDNVLNLRMVASQFLTSGVTAGITYAALHLPRFRDGVVALLIWFIVLTFLVERPGLQVGILNFAYIAGVAGAVCVYVSFVRRGVVRGPLQRVAASGVVTAIANALITVLLGLTSRIVVFASVGFFASTVFRNLQYGTLVGIGIGVGAELAELLIGKLKPEIPRPGAPAGDENSTPPAGR
ncbi:MAG TPA: hypothetical protein VL221_13680 [Bacteroidota bacterium]|nr:hypothetical protein [Bacteroidota bacterium]